MGEMRRIDMMVDEDLGDAIAAAIAEGAYPDVSAVVEAALRRWQVDRAGERNETERLRTLWQEGIASGGAIEADDEFFEGVKRRGRERLAAMHSGR